MRCPSCSRTLPTGTTACPKCDLGVETTSLPTEDLSHADACPAPPLTLRRELAPGSRIADRFLVVEKIGEGGMGLIYKAIDTRLDQPVALKMIRPAVARHAGYLARFKDEVRIARRITHPNVCRVHDLGDFGDSLYLSMEWIQGETLRQLLNRAGALEPERAFEIAAKIAAALSEAHGHGIIHRDLKPENVMIDEQGDVRVMDFGIAILAESQAGRLTGPGPSGTPDYMAPEQRRGEELDGRADLFSLGLILREMLAGHRIKVGEEPTAGLRPGTGKGTTALLESLLAASREKRFASAGAVVEALDAVRGRRKQTTHGPWRRYGWPAVAGVLMVGSVFLYANGWRPFPPPAPVPGPMAQSFYNKGLDFLRNHAETSQGLDSAIAMLRRAVEEDPGMAKGWAVLGEALWGRFMIDPEASTREEAAAAVARALELAPDLPEAHDAEGRGLMATGNYAEARLEFKKATEARPESDIAWAYLGTACREVPGGHDEGLAALQKAIALNGSYDLHWVQLGYFHERFSEWELAAEAYRKATELKPDSLAPWNNLGGILLRLRRNDEAIQAFQHSFELQETPEAHTNLGTAYFFAGRFSEAAEHYRLAAEVAPDNDVYWQNLGDGEVMLGREDDARHAYMRARVLARDRVAAVPLDPAAHRRVGVLCAKTGDSAGALKEGARALELAPDDPSVLFANAVIRRLIDQPEEALDFLERAVKAGYPRIEIENDVAFRDLRTLPRYRQIVDRAK